MPPAGRPSLAARFHTRNRALAREIGALARAVELPSTVLIVGESGVGKDWLAHALHDCSARAGRPFVRIDAANLSDELFESELFGHERGAFTGAVAAKAGLLEVAGDGTAYLDEASSLSAAVQAKFLRVLQEKTFRRLGGVASHPFRARLVVSSRRDLSEMVAEGTFRPDLFYRIDVVSIRLPRLRERPEDILPLARLFLRKAARAYGRPSRRFAKDADGRRARGPSPGRVRLGGGDPGGGRRKTMDAARADGRLYRGDLAPGRRQPDPRGQTPRRLAQVALGTRAQARIGQRLREVS